MIRVYVPTWLRMRLSGTALARIYARMHERMYRLSGGRVGGRIRSATDASGPPVLLLTTTGRRTGEPRTSPVIYLRRGDDFIVAAANAGNAQHPAWWLNLQAHPHATVQVGPTTTAVVAAEIVDPDREEVWREYVRFYSPIVEYQRSTPRQIPLVALRPASGADTD